MRSEAHKVNNLKRGAALLDDVDESLSLLTTPFGSAFCLPEA